MCVAKHYLRYCGINKVGRDSNDYYSFCKSLASQLFLYANALNEIPFAQPKLKVDSYNALIIINYFVWLKCMVACKWSGKPFRHIPFYVNNLCVNPSISLDLLTCLHLI